MPINETIETKEYFHVCRVCGHEWSEILTIRLKCPSCKSANDVCLVKQGN